MTVEELTNLTTFTSLMILNYAWLSANSKWQAMAWP